MRVRLSAELGIDPGPDLRQLHQQILQNDLTLLGPSAHETGAVAQPVGLADPYPQVPRQIPPPDGYFTGRRDELETLVGQCGQAQVIVCCRICSKAWICHSRRSPGRARSRLPSIDQ
ncbi:hypothetical protein ACQPYA_26085 [Micromonospora sp. CA-263727]|uniref:hypothetical protein n=1 Tax=Micromonospora sp. CA-263727 TaxID=3239967 RepID=UPI003D900F09